MKEMGGIQGISVSHPHFYSSVVEWSHAFGGAPIYVPEADREHFVRPDPAVRLWSGTLEVWPSVTLVQGGGHFEGSAVLHWAERRRGKGHFSLATVSRWRGTRAG